MVLASKKSDAKLRTKEEDPAPSRIMDRCLALVLVSREVIGP